MLTLILLMISYIAVNVSTQKVWLALNNGSNKTLLNYNYRNNQFQENGLKFSCELSLLWVYYQSNEDLINNNGYILNLQNFTKVINLSISSVYNNIKPTLNYTVCQIDDNTNSNCYIEVKNGCKPKSNFFNYYDRIRISIQTNVNNKTESYLFTYNVLCDPYYQNNTFQWGLVIEIILCTIVIVLTSIYSKAWSLGGFGISIKWYTTLIALSIVAIGIIISAFVHKALNIMGIVGTFIFGSASVAVCTDELIFLWKKNILLKKVYLRIRFMDLISLLVGFALCIGWYFSSNNWIVNDIISLCMIIAGIKILKFTSLRNSLINSFLILMTELIASIVFNFIIVQAQYNDEVLYFYNNPFLLQIPTINPVFQRPCSWLVVTSLIFPGSLLSYMRRFDSSRNTYIYLITFTIWFIVGSIVWMLFSFLSKGFYPFGMIAQPLIFISIGIFAYRRSQIRTLWQGKFYDQQFANKEGLDKTKEMIEYQRRQSDFTFKSSLVNPMKLDKDRPLQQISQPSQYNQENIQ